MHSIEMDELDKKGGQATKRIYLRHGCSIHQNAMRKRERNDAVHPNDVPSLHKEKYDEIDKDEEKRKPKDVLSKDLMVWGTKRGNGVMPFVGMCHQRSNHVGR